MKALYAAYIQSKAGSMSPTSIRSESVRLNRFLHLVDGDAQKLMAHLSAQDYGSYTKQTIWTRVSAFWDWGIANAGLASPNPYKAWHEQNPRAFRGAYKKNPCKQTYDEIMRKLKTIKDSELRNTAIVLLVGGLRIHELWTIHDGHVIGKGSKRRKVYLPDPLGPIMPKERYGHLLRELKRFGLTPHKLRHARMSHMAESGASTFELMKFAGWSNIDVAQSYIHARDERVQEIAMKAHTQSRVKRLMEQLFSFARELAVAE